MRDHPNKHIALYDGECGICFAFHTFLKERDTSDQLWVVPYQVVDFQKLPSTLDYETARNAFCLLCQDGKSFTGARAVFESLKYLNGFWKMIGQFFSIPILSSTCEPFYRLIARKRMTISRLLGFTQCAIRE